MYIVSKLKWRNRADLWAAKDKELSKITSSGEKMSKIQKNYESKRQQLSRIISRKDEQKYESNETTIELIGIFSLVRTCSPVIQYLQKNRRERLSFRAINILFFIPFFIQCCRLPFHLWILSHVLFLVIIIVRWQFLHSLIIHFFVSNFDCKIFFVLPHWPNYPNEIR